MLQPADRRARHHAALLSQQQQDLSSLDGDGSATVDDASSCDYVITTVDEEEEGLECIDVRRRETNGATAVVTYDSHGALHQRRQQYMEKAVLEPVTKQT